MEVKQKGAPKEKRRNNEKRKEKSRDAARSRRSRETEIFTDLANALPVAPDQLNQLDKASVMRIAISYLRVRDMITLITELPDAKEGVEDEADSDFLKSLEGFLLVLSADGDFVYLSENVSEYLGISQIDLMGQNIYEYSHPCDHDEIKEILSSKTKNSSPQKSFFIRLKCTLTSKGRSVNLKSATYKVLHCTGHMLRQDTATSESEKNQGKLHDCLAAIAQPIPHPSNIETPLPRQTFLTKHSLDMKFTNADDKIMTDILGYSEEELLGKSVYEFHHAMDNETISSAYKCLFSKGQCETNRYRFLAKSGGYVWVLTQATLIHDKMQKPHSIVCVNYVISGVECENEIYSASQLSYVTTKDSSNSIIVPAIVVSPPKAPQLEETTVKCNNNQEKLPISVTAKIFVPHPESDKPPSRPQTATSKIFAPRTEDMSKGFLTFSDDEPGLTMLKEEPEDLTHLAPVAGDVCVPLNENPYLSDLFDDVLFRDNFQLLPDDEIMEPFLSYRNPYDPSPQLLSPNLSKHSDCSLPSLNSPCDSLGDEEQVSSFINLQMDDDSQLSLKTPFTPMNIESDLPLLMSNDLMWSNNDRKSVNDSTSTLAQLLSTSVTKHGLKSNDHGGGLLQYDQLSNIFDEESQSNWSSKSPKPSHQVKIERTTNNNKRTNSSSYNSSNKRTKGDQKEKMSPELLQQLMSNNHNRGRPKGKSNWLLDTGGQKAACVSQPSDSVLMNLLEKELKNTNGKESFFESRRQQFEEQQKAAVAHRNLTMRKKSISLLNQGPTDIPSLLDLSQQDFEVNAPVNHLLLQGQDLLMALEANGAM